MGSLFTGFWLLGWLTAPGLWRANAVMLFTFAAALALASVLRKHQVAGDLIATTSSNKKVGPVLAMAGLGISACVFCIGPTAVWRHSGIGAGRIGVNALTDADDRQAWAETERRSVRWEYEGKEASVALKASDAWSFSINGKIDGNAVLDASTQIMLGLLGAIIHPDPKRCLVVGLGTGETGGWLASVDRVEHVDIVEIEPGLMEVARVCSSVNRDVLNQDKANILFEDAREVLLTRQTKYDLIVSEPSNPYRVGIANLFTREFYRGCTQRMNPDAVFVQWLQAYEVDWETVLTVLCTLRQEFASVEVWQSRSDDLLLVCHRRPVAYDDKRIVERLNDEAIAEGIKRAWRVEDSLDFWARHVLNAAGVDRLIDGLDLINTDDHNLIEFGFARTLGRTSDFSLPELSIRAIAEGLDQPRLVAGAFDSERLLSFRQVMYGVASERPFLPPR